MQVILQGSLRHFPAAELMHFLCHRGQNGTLDFENAGRRARVLFEADSIVWAESNKVSDPMEAVLDVFEWPAGSFTLLDSVALPEKAQPLSLKLQALVDEARLRAELPYRDHVVLHVVENPGQQQVSLTGDEFKILFRLAAGRSFGELAKDLGADRKELGERVKKLEDLGLVAVVKEEAMASSPAPEPPAERVKKTREKAAPPAAAPPPPAPEPPKRAREEDIRTRMEEKPAMVDVKPPAAEAPRPEPPPAEATVVQRRTVMRPRTLVGSLTPDESPETIYPLLDDECTIGRTPDNAVSIQDGSVSSKHARIVRTPEGFTIEDLKSRNGTFVNGEKVEKARLLADGDLVRIGKVIMTFNIASEMKAGEETQPEVRLP